MFAFKIRPAPRPPNGTKLEELLKSVNGSKQISNHNRMFLLKCILVYTPPQQITIKRQLKTLPQQPNKLPPLPISPPPQPHQSCPPSSLAWIPIPHQLQFTNRQCNVDPSLRTPTKAPTDSDQPIQTTFL